MEDFCFRAGAFINLLFEFLVLPSMQEASGPHRSELWADAGAFNDSSGRIFRAGLLVPSKNEVASSVRGSASSFTLRFLY